MDLLSFLVQENETIEKSTSVKDANSLPELGKNIPHEKFCRSSKSLSDLKMSNMSEDTEFREVGADLDKKKSHHLKEVTSDTDSASPVYSDDFDESSIDENQTEFGGKDEGKGLCEKVKDGIKDIKEAKQKLMKSPQQKVLSTAIGTLEGLVKQLKEEAASADLKLKEEEKIIPGQQGKCTDLKTNDNSIPRCKQLQKILEERDEIIKDLEERLQESAVVIEERSEVAEKLLNRLLVSIVASVSISLKFFTQMKIGDAYTSSYSNIGGGRSPEPGKRRSCPCLRMYKRLVP